MSTALLRPVSLHPPDVDRAFLREVLAGLGSMPKQLSPKWFYDTAGSELFERITQLPEYYPTRTEIALLAETSDELRELLSDRRVLIEYGSGSSRKTRLLLRALPELAHYLPVDVAAEFLRGAAEGLGRRFSQLRVRPIVGDFNYALRLPAELASMPALGFFPGSTIGNLAPQEAVEFLRLRRAELGSSGRLLLGVDLRKPVDVLLAAYDDAEGITAAFNKNLLRRINSELGADIQLERFAHQARWNDDHGRIEMHLVSRGAQRVHIGAQYFDFADGESIHTENSHKYRPGEVRLLARVSGWEVMEFWSDPQGWFAIVLLG